jgi:predicted TIM-barrel fold metal-dependent hydrolase
MRVIDVDSHLHEPLDWVERTDPGLAESLGPPARFMDIASSVFGFSDPSFASLPEAQQPQDRFDLVPPGFVKHLELTDTLQPDHQELSSADPFYGPDARLSFCDERGIDVQFLNPTFLVGSFVQASRLRRNDLQQRIRQCWNRWATETVDGHTDRLIPVTQIDLGDIDWSLAEMTRMREQGSKAFVIPEAPVGGGRRIEGGGRTLARSISHPDFDPIWDAAEDLGMAAFAHVGFARERINPGWANNGADNLNTHSLLNMLVASQIGPQLLVGALVYDGVLERHPKLTVVVEEVGIDWLPHLFTAMELSIGRTGTDLHDDEIRPSHLVVGDSYTLPLTPAEYVRRQIRVTPLPATHPLQGVIEHIPPEVLCFSSDYPHVEGSASAVELCERQLASAGVSDAVRCGFFGGIGELLGV